MADQTDRYTLRVFDHIHEHAHAGMQAKTLEECRLHMAYIESMSFNAKEAEPKRKRKSDD